MVVIGVTGNIGSGKSTVCQIVARLGAVVIDADRLAHEAYRPHSRTWQKLVDIFGKDIVKPDGEIDRQKLGQIAFSNPDALAELNQVVHPEAYRLAKKRIAACRRRGVGGVVVEATLLIEAGWQNLVDEVWLVVAPEAAVLQRLGSQEGISQSQILARLKSQMPAEEKMQYANEIIYNDGSLAQLESRVTELWRSLNMD
jgi:dephospho-CoA kinase